MAATLTLLFVIALIMACLLGIVLRVIRNEAAKLYADERACARLEWQADETAQEIASAGLRTVRGRPVIPSRSAPPRTMATMH